MSSDSSADLINSILLSDLDEDDKLRFSSEVENLARRKAEKKMKEIQEAELQRQSAQMMMRVSRLSPIYPEPSPSPACGSCHHDRRPQPAQNSFGVFDSIKCCGCNRGTLPAIPLSPP